MPGRRGASPLRVCYLHGRPGAHPLHQRFARAVGGEFRYADAILPWQDQERSMAYRVVSSLLNAAALAPRREYAVFLVDNLHFAPVLLKLLFLRRSRQKIVAHMGSHTLYFLRSGRFRPWVTRLHLWALRHYDALICEGEMAQELVRALLGPDAPPTYVTFLGPPRERAEALAALEPDLEGARILLVAQGPSPFRLHYKGLDLAVASFAAAAGRHPGIELVVAGEWGPETVEDLTKELPGDVRRRIHFKGAVSDIPGELRRASLYLHVSRGDAFPTSSVEAMAAGVVPLVSEWTGTRALVREVHPELVAPLDAAAVGERILWYFGLPPEERRRLSDRCRSVSGPFNEQRATEHYVDTFGRICADLALGPRPS